MAESPTLPTDVSLPDAAAVDDLLERSPSSVSAALEHEANASNTKWNAREAKLHEVALKRVEKAAADLLTATKERDAALHRTSELEASLLAAKEKAQGRRRQRDAAIKAADEKTKELKCVAHRLEKDLQDARKQAQLAQGVLVRKHEERAAKIAITTESVKNTLEATLAAVAQDLEAEKQRLDKLQKKVDAQAAEVKKAHENEGALKQEINDCESRSQDMINKQISLNAARGATAVAVVKCLDEAVSLEKTSRRDIAETCDEILQMLERHFKASCKKVQCQDASRGNELPYPTGGNGQAGIEPKTQNCLREE